MLDIKPIIVTYCSDPDHGSCHAAGTLSRPDFSTYDGVKEEVDNGQFEHQVFVTKEMPDPDTDGPKFIHPDDLQALRCWLDDGAPNN